ncbi:THUMP domain-containing class I SAM-dependent RNA methyltransferase [Lunatibacter salilacus]|uniref:THUMP domain-containing class I SAM-dependent RNA methyltransferase n=1 Tax=Lunatibacter salilacus TaxID=2483804 RepID=UPI00131B25A4|nr:class I SAM-dependent RNA methyltransferase [Lunatibacter salilacus]
MIDFAQKGKITVTCFDRFAPNLEQEIIALGFTPTEVYRTRVTITGSLNDCMFLNLHLRTASNVLFWLADFPLHHVNDLYGKIKSQPWENYLAKDGYFSVSSTVDHETVDNPLFVNVRIKDAIVDRFRDQFGVRPNSGSDFEGAVIQLYWKNNQASLYLNTSGETLVKHGYRQVPGKAPMMEALAAATILASNWDRKSPFINPMCGAGTLAIEAALIATDRFPGLYRDHYSFMHFLGYDEKIYRQMKKEVYLRVKDDLEFPIIASDISPIAITAAKINTETAGVQHLITFETCDFAETTVPEGGQGVVFLNPEYGQRLGDVTELEATYKRIGDFMKQKCAGYAGLVFTGNMDLGKQIGLKPKRKIPFYNGTLDCRLLHFELYAGTKRRFPVQETE